MSIAASPAVKDLSGGPARSGGRLPRKWVLAIAVILLVFGLAAPRLFFSLVSLAAMALLALSVLAMLRGFRRNRAVIPRALWISAATSLVGLAVYRLFVRHPVDGSMLALAFLSGLPTGWAWARGPELREKDGRVLSRGNFLALGIWAFSFLLMQWSVRAGGRGGAFPLLALYFCSAMASTNAVGLIVRASRVRARPDSFMTSRKGPTLALLSVGALGLLLALAGAMADPPVNPPSPSTGAGGGLVGFSVGSGPAATPATAPTPPSTATPRTPPPPATRAYRHAATGIQMDIPGDWIVTESRNGFEIKAPHDDLERMAKVIVSAEPRGPRDRLDRKMKEVEDPLRLQPGFRLIAEQSGTGAGTYPARRFAAAVELQGVSIITDTVLIETDRRYILFSLMAPEQALEIQLPHATRALESLRVAP